MDTVDPTINAEVIPGVSPSIPDDGRRPGEINLEEAAKLLGVSPTIHTVFNSSLDFCIGFKRWFSFTMPSLMASAS